MKEVHDNYVEIGSRNNRSTTKAEFEEIWLKPPEKLTDELMDFVFDEIEPEGERGIPETN